MERVPVRPFLTQPWEAGAAGWITVVIAILAELILGIAVSRSPMVVAAPLFAFPAAFAVGLAIVQWLQVRVSGSEPSNWWHLGGIGVALITWAIWPLDPVILQNARSARHACVLIATATPGCIARASAAMASSNLTWWLTGAAIVFMAVLVRRSRIAAWAAIPVAFAGCMVKSHFLDLLVLHYHPGG